jgi:HEPN domain-containing protein
MSDDKQPEGRPEDPIEQWFWLSDYERAMARDALSSGRLLYVYFHCQQSLEKKLKGMYARATSKTPPYTHALVALAESLGLKFSPAQKELMVSLTTLYSELRYPTPPPPEAQDPDYAAEALAKTEEMLLWLDQPPRS